jgi:5'-3' exoribonuclease 1
VLKPAHAVYRLQNQSFALGDRVTMVQDSGGVPLSAKGVVIGLNAKSMDVVWDNPFMSGVTLGDRSVLYSSFRMPIFNRVHIGVRNTEVRRWSSIHV